MSHITLDEMGPLLSREASARRTTLLGIFVAVSLAFLVLAFLWDKKYLSYVQLYVDDSQIVKPLAGVDIAQTSDQANVAREELFNTEILDRVVAEVGYVPPNASNSERERAKIEIVDNTEIYNINNQLLEIAYEHSDPKVAFQTTTLFADLFLAKTMQSSATETNEAFDFITNQVETYRNKLEDAEAKLESFRSQYPGISSSTENNVETQIVELRRDLENTQLQYAQADQRRRSLERELSSESSTIAQDFEKNQLRERIAGLNVEIENLRLDFTDQHPDIVQRKEQVAALTRALQAPSAASQPIVLGGQSYGGNNASPVYQQLRSDLARTAAEADSLRVRVNQLRTLLDSEIERSTVSSTVERQMAELTRDYQINKELYEDLLRRQESARLSMSLGAEQQGVLYRIAQPANFPYLPTGLRFMHIAAGGIVLASVLPFLWLMVFLKLDPRIRTSSAVTDVLELPLLATVPHMKQANEKRPLLGRPVAIVATVVTVCALYVVVFVIKYSLENAGTGGLL